MLYVAEFLIKISQFDLFTVLLCQHFDVELSKNSNNNKKFEIKKNIFQ